jgi:hypothetical protein
VRIGRLLWHVRSDQHDLVMSWAERAEVVIFLNAHSTGILGEQPLLVNRIQNICGTPHGSRPHDVPNPHSGGNPPCKLPVVYRRIQSAYLSVGGGMSFKLARLSILSDSKRACSTRQFRAMTCAGLRLLWGTAQMPPRSDSFLAFVLRAGPAIFDRSQSIRCCRDEVSLGGPLFVNQI